jgi:hypothetical protein
MRPVTRCSDPVRIPIGVVLSESPASESSARDLERGSISADDEAAVDEIEDADIAVIIAAPETAWPLSHRDGPAPSTPPDTSVIAIQRQA